MNKNTKLISRILITAAVSTLSYLGFKTGLKILNNFMNGKEEENVTKKE